MILQTKRYTLANGDAILLIIKPEREMYIYLRAARPEQLNFTLR